MLPNWLATIPTSTILVLCLSILMAFTTTLINRRLTSKEQRKQLRVWQREIKEWTSDFNRARRTGDKKLLKKVQKQNPIFDIKKLDYFNGKAIREKTNPQLQALLRTFIPKTWNIDKTQLSAITPLIKDRLVTLNDIKSLLNLSRKFIYTHMSTKMTRIVIGD